MLPRNFTGPDSVCTYWLGYSGGVDSTALLPQLVALRAKTPFDLKAIHIEHDLNPKAAEWTDHCAAICREWKVDYVTEKISVRANNGESIEALARDLRYKKIAEHMNANDHLITAHHEDDQAETILHRLMRGAGVLGLSGMREKRTFNEGFLIRPLLNVSREEILEYANKHKLKWIHDESNENTNFDRNLIRHKIMPVLQARWPAAKKMLARTGKHCTTAATLLDDIAADDLVLVLKDEVTLLASELKKLSDARQKNVLRYFFKTHSLPMPSDIKLNHVISDVIHSKWEAKPEVNWGNVSVTRTKNTITVTP